MAAFQLPGKRKKSEKTVREAAVQREIMLWLRAQGILFWVVKNTGTYDPKRKCFRKTPWYFRKGVPDIHGFYNHNFFVIECKRASGGVLSEYQKQFFEDFKVHSGNGAFYVLAENLADVESAFTNSDIIDNYV